MLAFSVFLLSALRFGVPRPSKQRLPGANVREPPDRARSRFLLSFLFFSLSPPASSLPSWGVPSLLPRPVDQIALPLAWPNFFRSPPVTDGCSSSFSCSLFFSPASFFFSRDRLGRQVPRFPPTPGVFARPGLGSGAPPAFRFRTLEVPMIFDFRLLFVVLGGPSYTVSLSSLALLPGAASPSPKSFSIGLRSRASPR